MPSERPYEGGWMEVRTLGGMLLAVLLAQPLAAVQTPPAGQTSQQRSGTPQTAPPQPPTPPARPSDPDPDLTPSRDLERAIERMVEEHLEQAMGAPVRGRRGEVSPEMERAKIGRAHV